MMKLLKNANIYTPSPIGKKDILIEGEKILCESQTTSMATRIFLMWKSMI